MISIAITKVENQRMPKSCRLLQLLRQYQVPFNALCVVNRDNAKRPLEVYRFIRDQVQPRMIQLIPGMESAQFQQTAPGHWNLQDLPKLGSSAAQPGSSDSVVTDWSIAADDWGIFLSTVWKEWLQQDFGQVFIDQFENMVSNDVWLWSAEMCVGSNLREILGGRTQWRDLFSCDHFVYPEYKLGNIHEIHQGDLVFSERQKKFAYAKSKSLPESLPKMSISSILLGRLSKRPFSQNPRWRGGSTLPVAQV